MWTTTQIAAVRQAAKVRAINARNARILHLHREGRHVEAARLERQRLAVHPCFDRNGREIFVTIPEE